MQETQVQSLGWEDPLEEEMTTHSSIMGNPVDREPGGLPSMGLQRIGHDWSWNSSTLATSCKVLTHWKRPWCWEGLEAGGEGDDTGWHGWMASPTRWTWVCVNSGSLWWTGRPGVLQFMGSQRVGYDWATELNWTEHTCTNTHTYTKKNRTRILLMVMCGQIFTLNLLFLNHYQCY